MDNCANSDSVRLLAVRIKTGMSWKREFFFNILTPTNAGPLPQGGSWGQELIAALTNVVDNRRKEHLTGIA